MDGKTLPILDVTDLKPGAMVRLASDIGPDSQVPFSDTLIVCIDTQAQVVHLARPYAYVSTLLSTPRSPVLLSYERFEVSFDLFKIRFRVVVSDRGNLVVYAQSAAITYEQR